MVFSYKQGLVLAVVLVVLDQLVKALASTLAVGAREALVPGVLWFSHVHNTGVAFGLFTGNNLLFLWGAIVIFGLLVYWYERFEGVVEKVAFWLVIAGLFGNLIDRIARGYVVDMFALGWWPVFNVADACISIAIVLLLYSEARRLAQKSSRSSS